MTQYRIDYVPDVPMTDHLGEPVWKIDAGPTGQPVFARDNEGNKIQRIASQLKFMLGRTTEPKFVENMESLEGVQLATQTQQALKKQATQAPARGFWLLDAIAAPRMRAATVEPRNKQQVEQRLHAYELSTSHNFLPAMEAIADMRKLAVIESEEPEAEAAE